MAPGGAALNPPYRRHSSPNGAEPRVKIRNGQSTRTEWMRLRSIGIAAVQKY